MSMLDREEYIEQLYFFQTLRERIKASIATQEVLEKIDQEILSTTKLPMAIQFLATEIKDSGLLSTGFKLLGHYFTPFQAFIIKSTEDENRKFSIDTGLHVLEKMAKYLADEKHEKINANKEVVLFIKQIVKEKAFQHIIHQKH